MTSCMRLSRTLDNPAVLIASFLRSASSVLRCLKFSIRLFLCSTHDAITCSHSELVTCVAEIALGERENLGGCDREHEGYPTTLMVKAAVAPLELPSPIPFCRPCLGQTFEHVIV